MIIDLNPAPELPVHRFEFVHRMKLQLGQELGLKSPKNLSIFPLLKL